MNLIAGVVVVTVSLFGQGTLYRPDPTHFVCKHCSLAHLVQAAFGIRGDQLSGPAFLDHQLVDATADIPPGATEEQYQQILRNLLETRLGLVVHHEQRTVPAFELVVSKVGPHMGDTAAADPFGVMPKSNAQPAEGASGKRVPTMSLQQVNGMVTIQGNTTMATLANALSNQLKARIKNSTGLEGKYSFALSWRVDSPSELHAALSRLGLELSPTTVPVDIVVVDHIDKKLK